jgi:hypothetical protein
MGDTSISRVCSDENQFNTQTCWRSRTSPGFFSLKTLTILMSLCIFSFDISGPFFSLIFKKGRKEGRMAVKADVKNEREGDIEKR